MKKYLNRSREALDDYSSKVTGNSNSGVKVIQGMIEGLPVLASSERSKKNEMEFDEKHYFVIPYKLSEVGFSLHTMRCLPDKAPEINDLPKRRIFHLPNEYYEGNLRKFMVDSAVDMSREKKENHKNPLVRLADEIDILDRKMTYGMLLVGGVTAIFNPIVGAGLAAKALVPGFGGLVNKFGLRPVGNKIEEFQSNRFVAQAEKGIARQFSEVNTLKVVNPILQELDLALRTSAEQHDPLTDPNLSVGSIPELDGKYWRELTEKAVYHVYKDIYLDKKWARKAQLGPEDLRWFEVLFAGAK
ncbi:hypothetical protein [Microbulbifer sp. GL-2]|uniref:hypothetical protein n=1 Tax=Microbulbifer sp. GL-2 TaxID=2591606 RepID=UPI0011642236|nr:hypothetical protein [Microbulbifer sp. GL-2]BBM01754.1 hypothetical protein GL2_18280 [Microbulbifer sp. GL-2]